MSLVFLVLCFRCCCGRCVVVVIVFRVCRVFVLVVLVFSGVVGVSLFFLLLSVVLVDDSSRIFGCINFQLARVLICCCC